jgi:magnesium-transporting ATPase (P-type)
MELPGDGIVIEGFNVEADESAMTGETEPMQKASIMKCMDKMNEVIEEGRANLVGHHEVPSPI